jgi:hypothetical protein
MTTYLGRLRWSEQVAMKSLRLSLTQGRGEYTGHAASEGGSEGGRDRIGFGHEDHNSKRSLTRSGEVLRWIKISHSN